MTINYPLHIKPTLYSDISFVKAYVTLSDTYVEGASEVVFGNTSRQYKITIEGGKSLQINLLKLSSSQNRANVEYSTDFSNCYARPLDYDAGNPTPDEPCGPYLTFNNSTGDLSFEVDGRNTGS